MTQRNAAIVTGASRGIGREIVLALAEAGAPVGLIARDRERIERLAAEVNNAGGTAAWFPADVTDAQTLATAMSKLSEELPTPITLLVNNAGQIDLEVPLWEADPAQWRSVIETNLVGSFNASRALIPLMLEHGGGRVVDMTSGAGANDWAVASAYTASKAGVFRNIGGIHEAGFDLGLRAFAVAPGVVKTDMTSRMKAHEGRTEFTPVSNTTDLIVAIHNGELDAWSGKYLRATSDSPDSLAAYVAEHGEPDDSVRRLAITPLGGDDPLLFAASSRK